MQNNVYILSTTDKKYILVLPALPDNLISNVYLSELNGFFHLKRNETLINLNIPTADCPDILRQDFIYVTEIDIPSQTLVRDYKAHIK